MQQKTRSTILRNCLLNLKFLAEALEQLQRTAGIETPYENIYLAKLAMQKELKYAYETQRKEKLARKAKEANDHAK